MTFDEFIHQWKDSNDFVPVMTSGSTGNPKEILLKKDFMARSAKRTNRFFNLNQESLLHSCVAADFIGGKMMAVRSFLAGAYFSWERPTNSPLTSLSKNIEIDLLAVVPSQMLYIVSNLKDLPHLRNIIVGGSAIHPGLREKICSESISAFETYGMTETASHIALRKITKKETPFITLPGISLEIDSDNCLVINFEEGESIHTNDIVELISPTEFFVKGRKDNIIISGAKKINPSELEGFFSKIISQDFCVTGLPDEKWGTKVVMVIEGKENCQMAANILEEAKKSLDAWKIPKEIIFIPHLPRTINGKIIPPKDSALLASLKHDICLCDVKQNRPKL